MLILRLALLLVLALVLGGCGGYAVRMEGARNAVHAGDFARALDAMDQLVAEAEAGQTPQRYDYPLLLMERASLHLALGNPHQAAADLAHADPMLELLDLTPDRAGEIGQYLWSDDAGLYRAPPYEKLMVNVVAAAAWLAADNLAGARVEARRIRVLLDYFDNSGQGGSPMLGAAAWIAGLVHDAAGDNAEASRMYLRAWVHARPDGLAEALVRTTARTPLARRPEVAEARQALGLGPDDPAPEAAQGAIVIVLSGLAPFRVAEYIPVGLVINAFRGRPGYGMSPAQEAALARATAEDLLTWVNMPQLAVVQNPLGRFTLQTAAGQRTVPLVADVGSFALAQWEADRPSIALAAIVRALVRVAAREVVQGIGRAAGSSGNSTAATLGFLAGLITQGAMQAADTPDTRTWTFMPNRIWVTRMDLPTGTQDWAIDASGGGVRRVARGTVTVPERGAGVIVVRFME